MSATTRRKYCWWKTVKFSSMKFIAAIFFFLLIYVTFVLTVPLLPFAHLAQEEDHYHRYIFEARHFPRREKHTSKRTKGVFSGMDFRRKVNKALFSRTSKHSSDPSRKPAEPSQSTTYTERVRKTNTSSLLRRRLFPRTEALSDRYPWMINHTNTHTQEVRHVVFVKVHKAASTTLFSIFIRFALSRQLNVMFPEQGNLLSQGEPGLGPPIPHPPSPPFLFDILCHHVIFNHTLIKPAFPVDTRYVAIIRDPLKQVQSAFYFYRYFYHRKYLRPIHSFEELVQNQSMFEPPSPYKSLTNNRMSIDLGLDPDHLKHPSYVSTFIKHLDDVFDLVLIADRFDESVLLLKRGFRWTLKDIVYNELNSNRKNVHVNELSSTAMNKFQRFQLFDVAIYKHFLNVFDQKVAKEGQDFKEEFIWYTTVQNRVKQFCSDPNTSTLELVIPSSKWDKEFTLHHSECQILTVGEGRLNKWSKEVQLTRMENLQTAGTVHT